MTLWNGTNSFSVSIKEGPRIVKILRSFFSLYSESHQQKSFCKNKKSWSLEAPISSLVVYPLKAWESAGTHARHGLRPCLVPGAPPLTLWLPPCPPLLLVAVVVVLLHPPILPPAPKHPVRCQRRLSSHEQQSGSPTYLNLKVADPDHL